LKRGATTFAGSTTPCFKDRRIPRLRVQPNWGLFARGTLSTTTEPSTPAFPRSDDRLLKGLADDRDTGLLIGIGALQGRQRIGCAKKRRSAAWERFPLPHPHARVHGVFTLYFLLSFGFGGRTRFDQAIRRRASLALLEFSLS